MIRSRRLFGNSKGYVLKDLLQWYDAINRGSNLGIWKDIAPGGTNDGVVENGVWLNKALQFNGINSIVSYSGLITPHYTIMGTMSVVHDVTLNTAKQPRFVDGTNSSYPGLYFRNTVDGKDVDFAYALWAHGKDQALTNPRTSPPDGTRVHVCYLFNGTHFRLYVNGVFITEIAATTLPANRTTNYLGGSKTTSNRYLKGEICNFMRYGRVLTDMEIKQNFDEDSKRYMK